LPNPSFLNDQTTVLRIALFLQSEGRGSPLLAMLN
jgi:hypothetical protein